MRGLERNKQKIYYSTYGSREGYDKWGNITRGYGLPVEYRIHVTKGVSRDKANEYGGTSYDRKLVTFDMNCPIKNKTRLWIGVSDKENYNYIVVADPQIGLNCITIPIKQVTANETHKD